MQRTKLATSCVVVCAVWLVEIVCSTTASAQSTHWLIEAESPQTRILLRADTLDITIGVKEVTPVKFTVEYTMKCKDKLCCIGTSTHCFIAGGRPVSLEQRLPELYAELNRMVKGS